MATNISVEGLEPNVELDTDPEPSFGVFLDIPVHKRMLTGIAIDLHYIGIEGFRERRSFFDISLTLKRRYPLKDKITEYRAGVAVGLGRLPALGIGQRPTTHLTLKGIFEIAFWQSRRTAWLAEATIFASPSGGNRSVDVTFSPTLLLRGGVIF